MVKEDGERLRMKSMAENEPSATRIYECSLSQHSYVRTIILAI